MTIKENVPFASTVGINYPAKRDDAIKTVQKWLDDKRNDDGAEGLWRIHDEIYDLSSWINIHPGGADWLKWTKVSIDLNHRTSITSSAYVYCWLRRNGVDTA